MLVADRRLAQPIAAARQDPNQPLREIFVPFEDLNVILENDKQRVFLTRQEYDDLVKQARPSRSRPRRTRSCWSSAEYDGELRGRPGADHRAAHDRSAGGGLFALPLDWAASAFARRRSTANPLR